MTIKFENFDKNNLRQIFKQEDPSILFKDAIFRQEVLGEWIPRNDTCRDCPKIENPEIPDHGKMSLPHKCRTYDKPIFHFNKTTGENIHPDLFRCGECLAGEAARFKEELKKSPCKIELAPGTASAIRYKKCIYHFKAFEDYFFDRYFNRLFFRLCVAIEEYTKTSNQTLDELLNNLNKNIFDRCLFVSLDAYDNFFGEMALLYIAKEFESFYEKLCNKALAVDISLTSYDDKIKRIILTLQQLLPWRERETKI